MTNTKGDSMCRFALVKRPNLSRRGRLSQEYGG
jgi:hypothetical protein